VTDLLVSSFAVSPTGSVFAGAPRQGVLRSRDGGQSWSLVNREATAGVGWLGFAVNNEGHVFVGGYGDIFRSLDDGDRWQRVFPQRQGQLSPLIQTMAIDSKGRVFAGGGRGVVRSVDNGDTWATLNNGLENTEVLSLVADPSGRVFAGTDLRGVFRLNEEMQEWEAVSDGLTSYRIPSLTVTAAGHLLAGTHRGEVFGSTDGGESWLLYTAGFPTPASAVESLAVDVAGYVFAGLGRTGVFRSVQPTTAEKIGVPTPPPEPEEPPAAPTRPALDLTRTTPCAPLPAAPAPEDEEAKERQAFLLSSWNADNGQMEWSVELGSARAFVTSDDPTRIATLGHDRYGDPPGTCVSTWDTSNGELLHATNVPMHTVPSTSVRLSPDFRWLAMFTHSVYEENRYKTPPPGPAPRPDRVEVIPTQLTVWDLEEGRIHGTFDGAAWADFSRDSARMLTFGAPDLSTYHQYRGGTPLPEDAVATWWDIESKTEIESFDVGGVPIRLTPGGSLLTMVTETDGVTYPRNMRLVLVDPREGGASLLLAPGDIDAMPSLEERMSFSVDGSVAATTAMNLRLWSLGSRPSDLGELRFSDLEHSPSAIEWVALSPGGDLLALKYNYFDEEARDSAAVVTLWDLATGELLRTFADTVLANAGHAVFVSEKRFLTLGLRLRTRSFLVP
jgi:photosystem II stability/assembly factor-like uncharacterized protein